MAPWSRTPGFSWNSHQKAHQHAAGGSGAETSQSGGNKGLGHEAGPVLDESVTDTAASGTTNCPSTAGSSTRCGEQGCKAGRGARSREGKGRITRLRATEA